MENSIAYMGSSERGWSGRIRVLTQILTLRKTKLGNRFEWWEE